MKMMLLIREWLLILVQQSNTQYLIIVSFVVRTSEVGGGGPSCNHIDFGIVFRVLPKLEEIHITYGYCNLL